MKTYGQVGYEAYAESTGGKTFDGRDMPKWDELPARIKTAWEYASEAILELSFRRYEGACTLRG